MSKLTTDRSNRLLTELLQVPGNDVCADCKSSSPRWASVNLGIFLCVSCASIHRKIGTHISKVKSINLDQWTKEQIDSIRVTGNMNSNAIYNPKDAEAPVNLHDSERDSELEKFIRNKYQYRKFMNMRDGSENQSSSSSRGAARESDRIEAGRNRARELLTPPVRSSSTQQPRAASPALTTKSPAPAVSSSPAPPTPSPSIPSPAPQALQPSPQPPLQMLSPSPQPPLQMLSPSPSNSMMSLQPGMMPMYTGVPSYQPSMYTGAMGPSHMAMSPPANLPGASPIWQDMAALQSGPALPSFQQQPLSAVSYTQTMAMNGMPMQNMNTGWMQTTQMVAAPNQTGMMATSPVSASYQMTPSQYLPMGGLSPLQAQYQQAQQNYAMQQMQMQQQQAYEQPQPIYVSNGVAMQPQMMPAQGANPHMWTQGGYATQGQWQG